MAPKTARTDKAEKSDKREAKKPAAKPEKKAAKAPTPTEEPAPAVQLSADEAEELEEAAEEAAATGGGNSSAAAALAAASGSTDMSASFKNFRHHPDMENFYRFIYENDLRHEALAIIDTIMTEKHARKAAKTAGKH